MCVQVVYWWVVFGAKLVCSSCLLTGCVWSWISVYWWVVYCHGVCSTVVVYWRVLFGAESVFSRCIMICCVVFQDTHEQNLRWRVIIGDSWRLLLPGYCQSAYSAGSTMQRYCSGGTSSNTRARAPTLLLCCCCCPCAKVHLVQIVK